MSRTTTLELPDGVGGTDLRPVLTLMPVPVDGTSLPDAPVATVDEEAPTPADVPDATKAARRKQRRRRREERGLSALAGADALRARVDDAIGGGGREASRRERRRTARAERRAAARAAARRAKRKAAKQAARQEAGATARRADRKAERTARRRKGDAERAAIGKKVEAEREARRVKRKARARTAERKAERAKAKATRSRRGWWAGRRAGGRATGGAKGRAKGARAQRRAQARAVTSSGTSGRKRVLVAFGAAHVATVAVTLRDALAFPDPVWDTAGIPRTTTVAKVAIVPFVFAPKYRAEQKPKLHAAAEALRLQGG
ncbi:MAG TPA: hypothetical protein VHK88_15115 [Aquihabitans sp.]|nr:hypothetical protein [Aquihabitans sp.]